MPLTDHTKEFLIKFEEEVAELFNNKQIRAPIHLYHGNEDWMLRVFEKITVDDWVCCTWRSHYQCLLKGVPPDQVKQSILDGKSISLCFPEYKVISSAIVGGILPISLGIAQAIKLKGENSKVYCWVGDMTIEHGGFWECYKYSINFNLPIIWIVENNFKSVCTPTYKSWGDRYNYPSILRYQISDNTEWFSHPNMKIIYYKYESEYPHSGTKAGRIRF